MGDTQASMTAEHGNQSALAAREESLRRAAIVLSSLPATTASMLLEKVDGYSRHIVQQAMATLHVVAPDERQSILESFKSRVSAQAGRDEHRTDVVVQAVGGVQDEILLGQSDNASVRSTPSSDRYGEQIAAYFPTNDASENAQHSHFQFLDDVSIDDLVTLFSGEHPQTIALVLSSISPKKAAEILPQLNGTLQKQTLSRIGRLKDVPDSTIAEVAQHLQTRCQQVFEQTIDCSGKRALQAIIAEMPELTATRNEVPSETTNPQVSPPTPVSAESFVERDATPALKIANGTRAIDDVELAVQAAPLPVRPETYPEEDSDKDATSLVDATHQHLIALPSDELVNALGRVSTRDALLTLCGLPNKTAESAISLLSRSKARSVRRGIESLGSLQLREIDAAKQAVAMVSIGVDDALYSSALTRAA